MFAKDLIRRYLGIASNHLTCTPNHLHLDSSPYQGSSNSIECYPLTVDKSAFNNLSEPPEGIELSSTDYKSVIITFIPRRLNIVAPVGLEPTRTFAARRILSPLCLPDSTIEPSYISNIALHHID